MQAFIASVFLAAIVIAEAYADTSCLHGSCQHHLSMLQLRHEIGRHSAPSMRHSTHECHGGNSPVQDKKLQQTCLFQNVCFNPQTQKFLYFAATDHQQGEKFDSLFGDNGFVNGALSVNIRNIAKIWPNVNISFEMVNMPFPEHAARVDAEVSVLFQPVGTNNFGHHIGDNMFAIYTMLTHFHVKDPFDSQLLTLKDCDEAGIPGLHHDMSGCGKLMSKLYASISRRPIQTLASHPNQRLDAFPVGSELLCFPNLIAGATPFNSGGRKELLSQNWWSYRSYMLENLGVKSATTLDRIVLSKKGSSLHPLEDNIYMRNADQVASILKSKWPKHNVTAIDFATIPLYEQAKMMAETFAFVTHPGGGSFVGFFLPPGATIILLTRQDGTRFFDGQEPPIWTNMYWIQARFIPINESKHEVDPVTTSLLVEEAFKHKSEFTNKGSSFAW